MGDKQLALLRIVPTEGNRHETSHEEFLNRQYQKAATIDTDTIEIRLTKEDGTDVPFTSGHVSITLHLKRQVV